MKSVASVLLACLVLAPAHAEESQVTPIQKVVQLMQGMLAKGKKEKQTEQVQYAAFKQFCDDTEVEKKKAIDTANEKIDVLKADIEMYATDIKTLTSEIAAHEEDISVWKGDIKAATAVRAFEKTDYEALHKDYSESVDALDRAIQVLKKQAYDRKQASFTQVKALMQISLIPKQAKQVLDAFLQEEPDEAKEEALAVTAPEAYGYEFQSHGIVEMLEGLLDKFIAERTGLEKAEMNAKHDFDMLIQDHTAQINQATQDRDEKSELKAKKQEKMAEANGELQDTTEARDADTKYLSDLVALCEKKETDFEARQQLRSEEIEAIQKAIEIIASDEVSGNAGYLPKLVQKSKAKKHPSLLEIRSVSDSSQNQNRVVQYLRLKSRELGSRMLSVLAQKVADDPFSKVKKMIKDLIVRLMEEATAEAEHKGWCDTELATNEHTRKEKTAAVEMLHAEIDELEASIAKLGEELAQLAQQVAELDQAMAEATKLRQQEKEKNTETIKDAGEAQAAVAQALTVLRQFYDKAGQATSLVQHAKQTPSDDAPAIFDSPYKGMQSSNGGVVGMLEVIESDFARLEAETKAAEATAQKEYQEFMEDSKVDKQTKETDIEHKTQKKQDEEQLLVSKKEDLTGTQKELDAALQYFDKLKPSCVDAGVSYEDRVARRKEEIQSLQEALKILNGEDIA